MILVSHLWSHIVLSVNDPQLATPLDFGWKYKGDSSPFRLWKLSRQIWPKLGNFFDICTNLIFLDGWQRRYEASEAFWSFVNKHQQFEDFREVDLSYFWIQQVLARYRCYKVQFFETLWKTDNVQKKSQLTHQLITLVEVAWKLCMVQ